MHIVVIHRYRVMCDIRDGIDYLREGQWLNMDELRDPEGYVRAQVLELISHLADMI